MTVDADELLRRYVLREYRDDHTDHLATCPDTTVTDLDAANTTYGCATGCDYVKFEATLTCPHGETCDYEYGEFGDISVIIHKMDIELRLAAVRQSGISLADVPTLSLREFGISMTDLDTSRTSEDTPGSDA